MIRLFLALLFCLPVWTQDKSKALRVAILKFDGGGSEEREEMGSALQAMLITDLASAPGLRLVERARLKDLLDEQELGQSGLVDTATIAKMGKLLGASHVLTGSCTIAGKKMRLDSRLLTVQGGEVVLAESIDGDKEAFFELEKALANRIIAALGVKLAPKERAELGRIHTADYQAFLQFGKGLRLHDAKQYDEAITALKEATKQDKDFKLAALTLDEYQRVILTIQNRAENILLAQKDLERAKMNKEAAAELALLEKLNAIAADSTQSRERRMTANYTLALMLTGAGSGSMGGMFRNLYRIEDRFLMQRQGDAAGARYVADALKAFPDAPLTVFQSGIVRGLLDPSGKFDEEFARATKSLFSLGDIEENKRNRVISSSSDTRDTTAMLHFDHRQSIAFQQQLYDLCLKLDPGDYHRNQGAEDLAKAWKGALELDKSTALLTGLSRQSDNPWRLKGLAQQIQENRDLAALLVQGPDSSLLREYLLLTEGNAGGAKSLFAPDGTPGPRALGEINRLRAWPNLGYLLLGNQPTWSVGPYFLLSTGPRMDALRTSELRYYRTEKSLKDPDAMVVMGATPREDFQIRFQVDFRPPEDFRVRAGGESVALAQGGPRPELRFLLGLQDIDCALQENPATQKSELVRPLRGFAVVFGEKGIQLLRIREAQRDQWDRKGRLEEEPLASSAASLTANYSVNLKVAGNLLTVVADGKRHTFKLPDGHRGFLGLNLKGAGYVGVGKIQAEEPKGR
jgi:TolB-like protein